ncbi:hypothetical protein [Actinoplanes sp. NPDC051494]|uniref:hypothetical protein n=1 Tax=Actinoplanes sp. NPDC051494 TaxID=3363907 RepID=UPI0037ADF6F7
MSHPHETASPTAKKRSPLPWVLFAVFLVALGVVLVPRLLSKPAAPSPVAESEADPLLVSVGKCDAGKTGLVKVSEQNTKLTVNGAGKSFPVGLDEKAMDCVLETLGIPGALSSRMSTTVGADGRLEGEWPGYSVTWTNDPEKGLDFTVTRTE